MNKFKRLGKMGAKDTASSFRGWSMDDIPRKLKCCGRQMTYKESSNIYVCEECGKEKRK